MGSEQVYRPRAFSGLGFNGQRVRTVQGRSVVVTGLSAESRADSNGKRWKLKGVDESQLIGHSVRNDR
jgi:hypothetical protein